MLCYSTGTAYKFAVESLPLSLGVNPIPSVLSAAYDGVEERMGQGDRLGGEPTLGQLPPPDSSHPEKPEPKSSGKVGEDKWLPMGIPPGHPSRQQQLNVQQV